MNNLSCSNTLWDGLNYFLLSWLGILVQRQNVWNLGFFINGLFNIRYQIIEMNCRNSVFSFSIHGESLRSLESGLHEILLQKAFTCSVNDPRTDHICFQVDLCSACREAKCFHRLDFFVCRMRSSQIVIFLCEPNNRFFLSFIYRRFGSFFFGIWLLNRIIVFFLFGLFFLFRLGFGPSHDVRYAY